MAHTSPVPVMVALIVASGSIVLSKMDVIPTHAVRHDGINKISRAALAKAGATETPRPRSE